MENGGGSAGSAGYSYQHAVAAWFASYILGEASAPAPFDLLSSTTLSWVRCESDQPVDDIMVGTSDQGFILCQTKRTVSLSLSAESELGKSIGQFVRQYLSPPTLPANKGERALDGDLDRLVLVCGADTPKTVQVHLRRVLDRLRGIQSAEVISQSAKSLPEIHALETVLSQARSAWKSVTGTAPSDDQVHSFLKLVRVVTLACEQGGADELWAKHLLRESVLIKPEDEPSCWAVLVSACSELATLRTGLSLHRIQDRITAASIPIRSARNFREDIGRLEQATLTSLKDLSYLSYLSCGSSRIKIARDNAGAMAATAAEQSILMVGEPGSGKSGALHDLAEDLVSRSVDVLYLSADRLDAASLGELRLELGISHDLCETLENWQGIGPAFLLIDSLDAARADPASRTLRDLLRRATDLKRWRVVASIRKFDLRYSPELQYLFKGTPAADSSDPEFARVSHVLVKRLSDTELGQVASQSSEMAACLPLVPVDLVNVVFNLKILAELIDEGVDLRGANPIQTQLELLELYWKHRVLKWPTRDVSEELLRSVVRTMVKRKTMRADRLAIAPAGTELHELLSRGVLVEWQVLGATDRNKLAFSHHVIFDFAVSTLLFRGDDDTLISALLDDPQLVLISRPSIVFHYHHVWSHDEHVLKRFWSLVSRLQDSTLPSIGKLIGPSVAVERATAAEDFGPLIWSLRAPGSVHEASEQTLNYVIGSLLSSDQPLGGLGAGPWSELAMDISYALGPSVAYNLRGLLSRMLERVDLLTDAQLTHCGVASRRLLEYAWSQSRRDRYLVIAGLENVCKTYRSDKTSSSALLWRALELDHVAQYGYEELPWIARQLGAVLAVDASFVEAVYCASFGHEETSAEPVQMGSSRLLALTSTRKQDFEGARWELGRFFAKFMSFDPVHATSTLITCVDSYVKNDRRISGLTAANSSAQEFELLGTNARIAQDYSSIWDREVVSHKDDIVVMLDVFGGYLKDLMAGESGGTVLQRLISLVASQNRWAAIWRRIIWAATEDPGGLGIKLKDFAFAKPILSGIDTAWAAGEFLRAVYPILNGSDKKRAEEAILGIVPREGAQDSHQALEYQRDQLLGCLPRDQLVLEGSIKVVDALESTGAVPANVPPFQMAISSAPFGEKEYLAEEGVQVDSEQNRRVQELEIPIRDFASKYMNAEPPPR